MTLPLDFGLLPAILGLVLAVYGIRLAQRSERRKRLVWDRRRSFPLASILPQRPGPKLTIVYEPESGTPVNVRGCYVTVVMLANIGREPIRRDDLAKGDPLRVEVSNTKVLDIADAGVTRKVIDFQILPSVETDGLLTAELTFAFMDYQDAAQIRVLTETPRAKIRVLGTVVGMPDGIRRLGPVKYSKLRNYSGWSLITAVFALSLVSGVSVFYNAVGSWSLWWVLLLAPGMIIFPGLISIAIGMAIWPGSSTRWPRGLQHEHRWEPAFPVPDGNGWVLMELGDDDSGEDPEKAASSEREVVPTQQAATRK